MYTYRIVLDAYNSRDCRARSARVVTYSQGHTRAAALRRIGTVFVAQDGTVSDGINSWPGATNLPSGPYECRSLPEWDVVSIRTVSKAGVARIEIEYAL